MRYIGYILVARAFSSLSKKEVQEINLAASEQIRMNRGYQVLTQFVMPSLETDDKTPEK